MKCNLTVISLVLTVLGAISSTVTMCYFGTQLSFLTNYNYIYDYTPAICTPIISQIRQLNCKTKYDNLTKYILLWLINYNNQTVEIVEDPFSAKSTRGLAFNDRLDYNLNTNYSCLCQTNMNYKIRTNDCQFWSICIFDVNFINYIQRDNDRYYFTYISFILASFLSFILGIISIIITLKEFRSKKIVYAALDQQVY